MFNKPNITQKLAEAVGTADSSFSLAVGGNYSLCAKHYLMPETVSTGTVVSNKN
jgi:hypothetical protein